MSFSSLDYFIFICYCSLILGVGLFVSKRKKGVKRTAKDYFLAGKSLPWWAVGASLIAANISAEQFIGMSGSGFVLGLAIASYEWMGGIGLLIVGKYFLPIFIKQGLYTIPEFVERRFSEQLKTILAIFWIALFVFVNLSSVLYLGSLALQTILGIPMIYGIIGLAVFAAAYSLYGGLSAVAWTDVIQVVFLVLGGLVTTYLALNIVSGGEGVASGFMQLIEATPERFAMILDQSNDQYNNLPGIWVLIGGLWVANLYYWGFNQYIIQRTLAAKSINEAQKGIAFAAFLKMIIPFIVVIPGIAAYVIVNDPELLESVTQVGAQLPNLDEADRAYPWLLQLLPSGLKGIAVAALTAAIVSSLASMLNSTSTIFTMDIYVPYFSKNKAQDENTVRVGRITAVIALIVAGVMAPLLGGIDQAFQFIQEYTGMVSPGILAVFLLGLFWSKTTNKGAIWGALLSIPIALLLKGIPDFPWMNQMAITCIGTMVIIAVVSYIDGKGAKDEKGLNLERDTFETGAVFNISASIILIVTAVIYAIFW